VVQMTFYAHLSHTWGVQCIHELSGFEIVVTRFNRRDERVNTMTGIIILRNKSMLASSAIASVVTARTHQEMR